MLERDVEILRDVVVAGDGFEQPRGDLVGIGVEEAQPLEAGERGESVEEVGEFGAAEGRGFGLVATRLATAKYRGLSTARFALRSR